MLLLTTLLISIIITVVLMPHARTLARKLQAVDPPESRKIHSRTMPRCGGMAMAVGAMTPIILWAPMLPFTKGLIIGTLIVVLFGIADDIKDLPPYTKLTGQLAAALVAIFIGGVKINDFGGLLPPGVLLPDWAAIPLTAFVIVGVTNATNLSDGLDGLAGGIALLIFFGIGYLSACEKNWLFVMIATAVGGSVLGFLRYNSHPAQLFMGDAGSQFLGFVAIFLSISLTQHNPHLSPIIPLIILGVPILDTLTVMFKRLAKGHSPFVADKTHFHHQLIAMGLFHTEAVLAIYVVQAVLLLFVMLYPGLNDWLLLAGYLGFAGGIVGWFQLVSRTGYRVNRDAFLKPIKARMKPFKEHGHLIKVSFRIVKLGVPFILLFNALFPSPENKHPLFFSAVLLGLLVLALILNKQMFGRTLKYGLFLITPFLIFRCDQSVYLMMPYSFIVVYNLLYLVLLVAVLLTLKLTRRVNGFKSSPLDFLVIFVILLIPNLPGTSFANYRLGLVAAKTVIMFYSYEVLIGELRRKTFLFPISAAVVLLSVKVLVLYI